MADLVREWKRAVHDPEVKALRARIAELEAALRNLAVHCDAMECQHSDYYGPDGPVRSSVLVEAYAALGPTQD